MVHHDCISIHSNVLFMSTTAAQAIQSGKQCDKPTHYYDITGADEACSLQMATIHALCEAISTVTETYPYANIVVCPENETLSSLSNACLLFGAYLLLWTNTDSELDLLLDSDASKDILHEMDALRVNSSNEGQDRPNSAQITNCWRALHHPRSLQWIGAPSGGDIGPRAILDVEMASQWLTPRQ